MRVTVESHLPAPVDTIWKHLQTPSVLHYIAAPIIRFEAMDGSFPEAWEPGIYHARLFAFGFLPLGQQTIGIEFPPADGDRRIMRDNGSGQLISRWDHWLFLEPVENATLYTDRVEIEAGLLTPLICLYARIFFSHRHRRWRKLIKCNFAQLGD